MSRNCFRIEHSAPCPQSAFPSCWDIARRTGHEPKRLQRREFRPFFDTFRLSYLAGCQIVCCHSDRKCAEPATNRWNNYDCVGKFTKRELSKIQLLAAIQPIFDAQGLVCMNAEGLAEVTSEEMARATSVRVRATALSAGGGVST